MELLNMDQPKRSINVNLIKIIFLITVLLLFGNTFVGKRFVLFIAIIILMFFARVPL